MEIFTIGFGQKSAEQFFTALRSAGIRRLVDVRLNNVSQLAGFTKRDDLAWFCRELAGIEYVHERRLAPTQELLDDYKKHKGSWADYEKRFLGLMTERKIEQTIDRSLFAVPSVLLCSEPTAEHCHRRLIAEYLRERWGPLEIKHL
jgi:uncharacterized protein (DUF488 family)